MKYIKNTDDIIDILKSLSNLNLYKIGEFTIGDIVFDFNNHEYGIILSVKPGPIDNEKVLEGLLKYNRKTEIAYYADEESKPKIPIPLGTVVLLTLSEDSEGKRAEIGTPIFRVRYTNYKSLKKINTKINKVLKTDLENSDLENHCQNECLLECTQECSLWKYRNTPKKT